MKKIISLKNRYTLIFASGLALLSTARAEVLVGYDFGIAASEVFTATTEAAGVSGSAITEASLFTFVVNQTLGYDQPGPLNPVLQTAPENATSSAALAVTNDSYFSFTVTPDALQSMNFTNLTFNAARGGGATPRGYEVRSSVDAFATSLGSADLLTARPTWTAVDIDLSAPSFDALTSAVEFRIYAYAPANTNSVEFDDIELNGTVSAIPEPSSLVLLGMGCVMFVFVRRLRKQ